MTVFLIGTKLYFCKRRLGKKLSLKLVQLLTPEANVEKRFRLSIAPELINEC